MYVCILDFFSTYILRWKPQSCAFCEAFMNGFVHSANIHFFIFDGFFLSLERCNRLTRTIENSRIMVKWTCRRLFSSSASLGASLFHHFHTHVLLCGEAVFLLRRLPSFTYLIVPLAWFQHKVKIKRHENKKQCCVLLLINYFT